LRNLIEENRNFSFSLQYKKTKKGKKREGQAVLLLPLPRFKFVMVNNQEKELSNIREKIYSKWEKGGITLRETRDLYFAAKEKYLAVPEELKTKEVRELMLKILFLAGRITEGFIEK